MRAAFFREHGGPIELGEVAAREPGPGEVEIEVRAAALNHLDLWVRRGIPGIENELPHVGGSDMAGVVRAVGPDVEGWSPGDRVAVNPSLTCGSCEWCERGEDSLCTTYRILGEHTRGGFAERAVVPAENLVRVPDGFDWAVAAAAPLVYQTAWRALITRAALREDETVLVTGASGGVSTAALQIARRAGARVLAVTSGPGNAARVADLGADVVIDRLEEDFVHRVRAETGKRGVDVVIDSVGEVMFEGLMRCLAPAGRLVTYGATTGPKARFDIRRLFWYQQTILGSTMASRDDFRAVMTLVLDGQLVPVIDDILPLDRAAEAYERLENGDVFGKLVLIP